jgi:hypothetical protein
MLSPLPSDVKKANISSSTRTFQVENEEVGMALLNVHLFPPPTPKLIGIREMRRIPTTDSTAYRISYSILQLLRLVFLLFNTLNLKLRDRRTCKSNLHPHTYLLYIHDSKGFGCYLRLERSRNDTLYFYISKLSTSRMTTPTLPILVIQIEMRKHHQPDHSPPDNPLSTLCPPSTELPTPVP